MESKLTEVIGKEASENLINENFLMNVFDSIEQKK